MFVIPNLFQLRQSFHNHPTLHLKRTLLLPQNQLILKPLTKFTHLSFLIILTLHVVITCSYSKNISKYHVKPITTYNSPSNQSIRQTLRAKNGTVLTVLHVLIKKTILLVQCNCWISLCTVNNSCHSVPWKVA